jgi:dienelactone hydrolase
MKRIFPALLIFLVMVSCATAPALDPDQAPRTRYTGTTGESPVGVIPEATLRDPARNREMALAVDYPTRGTGHPLLIFSHGFGSSHREYIALSSFWASQGYVVVRPSHADAGRLQGSAEAAKTAWEQQGPNDWRARVQDIVLVLDQLDQLEQRYPELQGKIDRTKVGVSGHSYGAFTAMLIGGARTFPGGTSYADPRVKALVLLSPPGPRESRGLTEQSWAELRTPTLFMSGTRDTGADETETPEWRRRGYELSPAGDKWLVVLQGMGHAAFTGRMDMAAPAREISDPLDPAYDPAGDPNRSPLDPTPRAPVQRHPREGGPGLQWRGAFNTVKALSLAFFDAYLRNDAEGRAALEGAAGRGSVVAERK